MSMIWERLLTKVGPNSNGLLGLNTRPGSLNALLKTVSSSEDAGPGRRKELELPFSAGSLTSAVGAPPVEINPTWESVSGRGSMNPGNWPWPMDVLASS